MATGISQSFVTEGEEVTGASQAPASSSSHFLAQVSEKTLRTLYVFAGVQRKADLRFFLEVLQGPGGFSLFMKEVDWLRGPDQDVADDDFWDALMKELDSGEFDLVIITPPCNTHSRARSSFLPGPRPIRNALHPWGFPWLEGKNLRDCELSNLMVRRTFDAVSRAQQVGAKFLMEHPEDLGRTASGDVPAALWQYEETRDLQVATGATTWALSQCPFRG